jgi:hypothetical protein
MGCLVDERAGTRVPGLDDEENWLSADGEWFEDWERRTRVHGARAPQDPWPEETDEFGSPFTVTRQGYYDARSAA